MSFLNVALEAVMGI